MVSQCCSSWRIDHLAHVPVAHALAGDRLGDAGAHLEHVRARVRRSQRLDLAAHRAGRLERVVHARQVRPQQLQSREPVRQPQVLVGGDVTEIPRERAHDRRVHARQLILVEMRNKRERALARIV